MVLEINNYILLMDDIILLYIYDTTKRTQDLYDWILSGTPSQRLNLVMSDNNLLSVSCIESQLHMSEAMTFKVTVYVS
jgi:hypothetical protein